MWLGISEELAVEIQNAQFGPVVIMLCLIWSDTMHESWRPRVCRCGRVSLYTISHTGLTVECRPIHSGAARWAIKWSLLCGGWSYECPVFDGNDGTGVGNRYGRNACFCVLNLLWVHCIIAQFVVVLRGTTEMVTDGQLCWRVTARLMCIWMLSLPSKSSTVNRCSIPVATFCSWPESLVTRRRLGCR